MRVAGFAVEVGKTLGRALILAGALMLAGWGYSLLQELRFERAATGLLEGKIHSNGIVSRLDSHRNQLLVQPRPGDIIGRIDIPRIHVSVIVLEGSNSRILRFGAGHIQGTALPGTRGNIAIAAHRDTFFRPVRDIRPNDIITLTTLRGIFQYRVDGTEIVDPDDIQVLYRTRDPQLTLVTCYPFYYLGAAPKRFIVHARQQS
jgi:LPXTG-site transpeptidase (sortase) family protein